VTRITSGELKANEKEKFIMIPGGPDTYDGIEEIVEEALSDDDVKLVRKKGSRKMIVKTNVWRKGQMVYIRTGSDRNETIKAHEENRKKLNKKVKRVIDNEVKIKGFDSGTLDKRGSWSNVFEVPGTLEYRCAYHPYMRGQAIVKASKS
jgi:hypothetical protein